MPTRVIWTGDRDVSRNMAVYGEKVKALAMQVATYFAPVVEAHAKSTAPWVDRTGNLRQGLTGLAQDIGETSVAIYLYTKMDYGKFVETRWAARYASILPTLEAHYEPVMKMLRDALK